MAKKTISFISAFIAPFILSIPALAGDFPAIFAPAWVIELLKIFSLR